MYELDQCRAAHPTTYIKINAFDAARGVESCALSFIVQRPYEEPATPVAHLGYMVNQ
jgi:ribulose-bisphosphate carboxylase small chain